MESVQPPSTGSQTSRVPAQRTRPGQTDPAPTTPPPPPKGRKLRLGLAVVGGVLALLCLGGAGIAFVLYDNATKPDRSAPDVVVDNYLRALLVERDDAQAKQYACDRSGTLEALVHLRSDLQSREKRFNTNFSIAWGSLKVQKADGVAEVSVEISISAVVGNYPQTDRQSWSFNVERQDEEWLVCGAVLSR